MTVKQAKDCHSHHSLPLDEALEVHLFVQHGSCLVKLLLVALTGAHPLAAAQVILQKAPLLYDHMRLQTVPQLSMVSLFGSLIL